MNKSFLEHKNREEQIRMYKAAFDQFPPITYNTVRKLFSHLHFITSQSNKNRMNNDNLSSVWGPTLMHHEVVMHRLKIIFVLVCLKFYVNHWTHII